jgi:SAM-dependent methyltransferase
VPDRTRPDHSDLAAAWERNAERWIAWARAEGHDSYWRGNRDRFLELLPAPPARVLDLGCGEGRLSRDLKALGYDVVGVDRSPTLVAAAREADPSLEVHQADACALPFAAGTFDLVIAFMSLQDLDDLPGAVREAARVLADGGRLCFSIVHPLNSAGEFESREDDAAFVIRGTYLDETYYSDSVERDGYEMEFASLHRPLEAYVRALADAGFLIEDLREPKMVLATQRWARIPLFLYIRASRR